MPDNGSQGFDIFKTFLVRTAAHLVVHGQCGENVVENGFVGHGEDGLPRNRQLFVNELTIEPDALRRMLDGTLAALLPNAQPGILRLATKLTMQHFIFSLDINGTISELRIPLK